MFLSEIQIVGFQTLIPSCIHESMYGFRSVPKRALDSFTHPLQPQNSRLDFIESCVLRINKTWRNINIKCSVKRTPDMRSFCLYVLRLLLPNSLIHLPKKIFGWPLRCLLFTSCFHSNCKTNESFGEISNTKVRLSPSGFNIFQATYCIQSANNLQKYVP